MCEHADPYREEIRTSRKLRKCVDCTNPIAVGERYVYGAGLYEGMWFHHATCLRCNRVRLAVSHAYPDECIDSASLWLADADRLGYDDAKLAAEFVSLSHQHDAEAERLLAKAEAYTREADRWAAAECHRESGEHRRAAIRLREAAEIVKAADGPEVSVL